METTIPSSVSSNSSPSRIQVVGLSHKGLQRKTNEDCIGIGGWIRNISSLVPIEMTLTIGKDSLAMVADGVGGHASGSLASQLAIGTMSCIVFSADVISESVVAAGLEETNREIWSLLSREGQHRGAGTTMAGIAFGSTECFVFNVGDSRIYKRQEQFLQLLSTDDRPTTGITQAGLQSNVLLQALGGSTDFKEIEPHIVRLTLVEGDEFLICTEGLSDIVPLDQIEQAIQPDLTGTILTLQKLAFEAGAPDNISIVYLRVN
jgi:serine/threonine protein phosphatase PrpC